jgi:hypothetical protein
MEIEIPFDFVAEVRCFFGRLFASSYAYFRMRSTPWRENTACCAGFAIRERAFHAGHESHRPQVDVLVVAAPERDQQTPERNVVRHFFGPSGRAEEHGVVPGELVQRVFRHHAPVLFVVIAAPVELVEFPLDTEAAAGRLQHAQALGHDLLADAVAGNHRDAKLFHGKLRLKACF